MISQFADAEVLESYFNANPLLKQFAYEFCKTFDCCVVEDSQYKVRLVTKNGFPAGMLWALPQNGRKRDGSITPIYAYESPLLGSRKRESINMMSVIKNTKKMNDAPNERKIIATHESGIRYALRATKDGMDRTSTLSFNHSEAVVLAEYFLKLDESAAIPYADQIKAKYDDYRKRVVKDMEGKQIYDRFAKGSYLIGVFVDPKAYFVTEISLDSEHNLVLHVPVKRYSTLMDCPEVAPHVPLIAAWAESLPNANHDSELKLPAMDKYYGEVDVATGYTRMQELWHVIPKFQE